MTIIIHMGDAGTGALACGANEKRWGIDGKNWTWESAKVTCKKCLKILERRRLGYR